MRRLLVGAALLLASTVSVCPSYATTVANFTDGNGTALADQYLGVAGSGWDSAWSLATANSATAAGTVTNSSPLNSGGNYLSVSHTVGPTGTSVGRATVRRQFGVFDSVDPSMPYTISFDFRPEAKNTISTNYGDRYQVFGTTVGTVSDSSALMTWSAIVASGSDTGPTVTGGNWGFLTNTTGVTAGVTAMTFVNSGISMVPGTVYEFDITVDPANKSYVGKISDGVTTFTSGNLFFRNQDASATTASWMMFGASQRNAGAAGATNYNFSLDSISVSVVPEPGSIVLISFAMVGVMGFTRRRQK